MVPASRRSAQYTMLAAILHSRFDWMSGGWSSFHRNIAILIHQEMDDSRLRRAEVATLQRDNASRSCARDTPPADSLTPTLVELGIGD